MKQSINDILQVFREDAGSNRYLGDKFERLVASYLKKDPLYVDLFSDVWLWSEWPLRDGKPDTGIDIVAKERVTGDYWAVQCKFFDPSYQLQKADIDSFFTASGKAPFKKRLIISTTDKWSKHAEDACKDQQIPVSRLRIQDLDQSPVDWSEFNASRPQEIKLRPKKQLRKHQEEAVANVIKGLQQADRGKLIMACGTGKTFTSLKIAEKMVPEGGSVLFLVPSISLISQTVTEWAAEAERPLSTLAVCSDPKAGKRSDEEDISTHDLAFPAHTKPGLLVKQVSSLKSLRKKHLTVIFSTYQSITVVSDAQKQGLSVFDLVICDEAHRTTGVEKLEYGDKDASNFIAVHDPKFLKAKKRLYMTATPRIYDDASKGKAKEAEVEIYSMDDQEVYGEQLHRLDFSEAVRKGLLSDYKVMVLAVDEKYVNRAFQRQLADKNNELVLDDVVKIVGCYNGLKKRVMPTDGDGSEAIDPSAMRRAVAFNRSIKDSQRIKELFAGIIKDYRSAGGDPESGQKSDFLQCEVDHVDGTFNALARNARLQWLKEDTSGAGNVCRILTNARCLSEGIDVPALDAVMFLNPRNSVVDVVQSVGRVMRKVEGKQYGYIILPIGIPTDVPPEEALSDNQKYKVVWQVLQALRAHDDRFNVVINQLDLNQQRPSQIQIIGVGEPKGRQAGGGTPVQTTFNFPHLEDWENAIFARIVIKCGNRRYWESWAQDVAKIAERHIARIESLLESADSKYKDKFDQFLRGLQKNLNPSVREEDAIEMLAQHLITKPVFDALFEGYAFTKNNPVSKTMQRMLDLLESQKLEKETTTLEKFYESVRERARGIDNAEGKQRIIIELYDKFFRTAFPKMAERLGIVYTPVEVVDFILKSADDILKQEFGLGLTDKNVHVLDPFTGTGTFITRLLQSEIVKQKDLPRKFRGELHANEIVLLAYYIAAMNIEEAYHSRTKMPYEPFEGIVLADTFQLGEGKNSFGDIVFPVNNERGKRQNALDIRVIVGNPPYSVGQKSANDANKNIKYADLDARIENTYAKNSQATLQRNLYDSYVRAIRWASDRVRERGIICFVSNASFIDSNATDGLRKCLAEEFSSIYCFNLRGDQRTSGELSRREGGKIFGSGSRAQIAITIFIKNPASVSDRKIFYHDIGDYLPREKKLEIISGFGSAKNVPWKQIAPNKNFDWINQRDEAFSHFIPLGSKKSEMASEAVFLEYSNGIVTNRDAWVYNFSANRLADNMKRFITFYNAEVDRFVEFKRRNPKAESEIDAFLSNNPTKISWSRGLKEDLSKGKKGIFSRKNLRLGLYRPFTKMNLYFDNQFVEMSGRHHRFFPTGETQNPAIYVSGIGSSREFSALMTNFIPNLHLLDTGQCFPLHTYRPSDANAEEFDFGGNGHSLNVSDFILKKFRMDYGEGRIEKEDIFYYVYGIFHSPEYKRRFAADLTKTLPRIPLAKDFRAFSEAGRKLAKIHLGYETAKPYHLKEQLTELRLDEAKTFDVQKMRFGKNAAGVDKSVIQLNGCVVLSGIPLEAYEYIVNGKSAIEWIMERYQVSLDADSQIVNDPNDWAKEHGDPKYILNLFKRIVTVSLETVKIVKALPPINERKA